MISLKKILEHCGHCPEDMVDDEDLANEAVGANWGRNSSVVELSSLAKQEAARWQYLATELARWENVMRDMGISKKGAIVLNRTISAHIQRSNKQTSNMVRFAKQLIKDSND